MAIIVNGVRIEDEAIREEAERMRPAYEKAFADEAHAGVIEGAQLQVELVEPKCECMDCGAILEPNIVALRCTRCNSLRVTLQHPHEMEVDVEV